MRIKHKHKLDGPVKNDQEWQSLYISTILRSHTVYEIGGQDAFLNVVIIKILCKHIGNQIIDSTIKKTTTESIFYNEYE